MRNLLFLMLALVASFPAFSQGPCTHSVTWTNVSTTNSPRLKVDISSGTLATGQKVMHEVRWGDGYTYVSLHSATTTVSTNTHWYASNAFGNTFNVKAIVTVTDTTTNTIVCKDSTVIPVTIKNQPCNAAFSVTKNPANNGQVTFAITSAAVASNTTYTWDFGDGNTGTGTTITHTYAQHGRYNVRVRTNTSHCNTWSGTEIVAPLNGCKGISGVFSKQQGTSLNALFYANAPYVGTGQITNNYFQWRFGDGNSTTSSMNNHSISHTYGTNGYYNVTLIVTVIDSLTNTVLCVDSTTKFMQIGPVNDIYVYLQRDSTIAPDTADYKVWLIKFDSTSNTLTAIDSQTVKSHYSFAAVKFINNPAGQYRAKAAIQNNPTTGTFHIPTYGASAALWSNATVISHNGISSSQAITMLTGAPTTGPGFVGGNVSAGANKGTANGIEGLNILLLDGSGNVVTYAVTDVNGDYTFSNLPNATYTIHPEDMNYTTTTVAVTISNGQASFTDINFERFTKDMTIKPKPAGISNVNNSQLSFVAFPNPATDVVTINWNTMTNETAAINITDLSGKVVLNTEVSMNQNSKVDVSNLHTGFYFMTVATENGTNTQKLIIQ